MITSIAIIHKQLAALEKMRAEDWKPFFIEELLHRYSHYLGLALSDDDASRIAQQVVDYNATLV